MTESSDHEMRCTSDTFAHNSVEVMRACKLMADSVLEAVQVTQVSVGGPMS